MRLLFAFLFFTFYIHAQTPKNEAELAKQLIKLSGQLEKKGQLPFAIEKLNKACSIFYKHSDWKNYYTEIYKLIALTREKDGVAKALELSATVLESCLENLGQENIASVLLMHQQAKLFEANDLFIDASDAFTKSAKAYALIYPSRAMPVRIEFLLDWAGFLSKNGQSEAALQKLKEAVYMAELLYGEESAEMTVLTEKAAVQAFEIKEYSTALTLARRSVNAKRKIEKKEGISYLQLYKILANCSLYANNASAAKAYAEKAIEIIEQSKTNSPLLIEFYVILSEALWQIGEHQAAIDLLENKTLALSLKIHGQQSAFSAGIYADLGVYYAALEDFKKAEYCLDLAIKRLPETDFGELSKTYKNLALCQQRQGKTALAEKSLLKAIEQRNCSNKKIIDFKSLLMALERADFTDPADHLYVIFEYLNLKYQSGIDQQQLKSLLFALKSYILKTELQLRYSSNYAAFTAAVRELLPFIFSIAQSEKYLVELSYELQLELKRMELRQLMFVNALSGLNKVPDSLSLKMLLFKNQSLNATERMQHALLNRNQSAAEIAKSEMLKHKREFENALKIFSEAFPKHSKSLLNAEFFTLMQLKNGLNAQSVILDYYLDRDYCWVFIIHKHKIEILQLELSAADLEELLIDLYAQLTNPLLLKRAEKSAKADMTEILNRLSAIIFEPIKKQIRGKQKLIISPDAQLNYLPFDLLLTDSAVQHLAYSAFPFLIKKHSIAYNYTAFQKFEKKENNNNGISVIFADYSNISNKNNERLFLEKLNYTSNEMNSFPKNVKIKSIAPADMDLTELTKHIDSSKIIHFAAHNYFNEINSAKAGLHIGQGLDNVFFTDNFIDLNSAAELVVFSAFEAGFGRTAEGEQLKLFSVSAHAAGSRALLFTLWNAQTASKAELLKYYYQHLEKGLTKAEALKAAKISYLKNIKEDQAGHPLFWAFFVQAETFEPQKGFAYTFWIWILSALCLISALMFYIYKRNKKFIISTETL